MDPRKQTNFTRFPPNLQLQTRLPYQSVLWRSLCNHIWNRGLTFKAMENLQQSFLFMGLTVSEATAKAPVGNLLQRAFLHFTNPSISGPKRSQPGCPTNRYIGGNQSYKRNLDLRSPKKCGFFPSDFCFTKTFFLGNSLKPALIGTTV